MWIRVPLPVDKEWCLWTNAGSRVGFAPRASLLVRFPPMRLEGSARVIPDRPPARVEEDRGRAARIVRLRLDRPRHPRHYYYGFFKSSPSLHRVPSREGIA